MSKPGWAWGWEGYCVAAQDSFLCAVVYVSQWREIARIIKLGKAHLDVDFFDRGVTVSLALNSFSSSGVILVLLVLGAAPWTPCLLWGWHRRRSCFFHPLQSWPKTWSLQGEGLAGSSAALMCTSAALHCQKGCSCWPSGSLFHSQEQANGVKLCGNAGKTD